MLEIIALIVLAKRIGSILREKGRKAGWYQFLLVVLWGGGQFVGFIAGIVLTDAEDGLVLYLFAIIGAALGATIAFYIANSASVDSTAMAAQQQNSDTVLATKRFIRSFFTFVSHIRHNIYFLEMTEWVLLGLAVTILGHVAEGSMHTLIVEIALFPSIWKVFSLIFWFIWGIYLLLIRWIRWYLPVPDWVLLILVLLSGGVAIVVYGSILLFDVNRLILVKTVYVGEAPVEYFWEKASTKRLQAWKQARKEVALASQGERTHSTSMSS